MKRSCTLTIVSTMLFLLVTATLINLAFSAPEQKPKLYFDPDNVYIVSVEPGQRVNFTVDVYVSNIEDVYAYQIVIKYNTTFLDIYDIDFPPGYIFEGKQDIEMDKFIEPGYVIVGRTLMGETPGVTVPAGEGKILVRLLCSIGMNGTTYLQIATVDKPVLRSGLYEAYTYFMDSNLEYKEISSGNADIGTCAITLGMETPPYAAFAIFPTELLVNKTVILNASKSFDPDGYIVYYYWEIVRGDFRYVINTTDPVAYYSFTYPGIYNVTLRVVDNDGFSTSLSQEVKVNYIPDPFDIRELLPFITIVLVVAIAFTSIYVILRVKAGQRFKE